MENAIIATEILGTLNLLVQIYGAVFETKDKSPKKDTFIMLMISLVFTMAIDLTTMLDFGWENHPQLFFVSILGSYITPFLVYFLFIRYIYLHISEKSKTRKGHYIVAEILCIIFIGFGIYYGLQGTLFVIDGGTYSPGEYYEGYLMAYLVALGFIALNVICSHRKLGLHDMLAVLGFMAVPAAAVMYNLKHTEYEFSVPSLTVSMLIIQIILQGDRETSLRETEQLTRILALTDKLTGLSNRLAFTEACTAVTPDEKTGVIFSDLNGLKYTNDTYGHKAGDKYLTDFADLLKSCFRHSDIYRISGDEFVVLVTGMKEELFNEKYNDLTEKINSFDFPVASSGISFGKGSEIDKLLEAAEIQMYENKKCFHENYPEIHRTQ